MEEKGTSNAGGINKNDGDIDKGSSSSKSEHGTEESKRERRVSWSSDQPNFHQFWYPAEPESRKGNDELRSYANYEEEPSARQVVQEHVGPLHYCHYESSYQEIELSKKPKSILKRSVSFQDVSYNQLTLEKNISKIGAVSKGLVRSRIDIFDKDNRSGKFKMKESSWGNRPAEYGGLSNIRRPSESNYQTSNTQNFLPTSYRDRSDSNDGIDSDSDSQKDQTYQSNATLITEKKWNQNLNTFHRGTYKPYGDQSSGIPTEYSESRKVHPCLSTTSAQENDPNMDDLISKFENFNLKRNSDENLPQGTKHSDTKLVSSVSNPFTSNTGRVSKDIEPNPSYYELPSKSKGVVLVFNYVFKNHKPPWYRKGAEFDSDRIRSTFEKLGYKVFVNEDKTRQDTFDVLQSFIESKLGNQGSFILFFLSHGDEEKKDSYFHTADRETIALPEIWELLSASKCPAMRGKPKIIFLNYCRGDGEEIRRYYTDDLHSKEYEAPSDLAIVQATLPGVKALRTNKGTVFIECLCEIINKRHRRNDFQELIYFTGEKMKALGTTTPICESIMFRKFRF